MGRKKKVKKSAGRAANEVKLFRLHDNPFLGSRVAKDLLQKREARAPGKLLSWVAG